MKVTQNDLAIYVYTVGVIITSAWLLNGPGFEATPMNLVIVGGSGLFWTAYFRWRMVPRFDDEIEEEIEQSLDEDDE